MAADGACPDVWCKILYKGFALDKYGNFTVPSLSYMSRLRAVCVGLREANRLLETPYDALVDYQDSRKVVPIRFSGGMHFGPSQHYQPLSIIRDKVTGQMFAVTRVRDLVTKGGVLYCCVDRTYSLARLAELLNGHSPDWSARLPDLHEMAYRRGAGIFAYRVKHATIFERKSILGAVTKNQLVAKEHKGGPAAGTNYHLDDCISHKMFEWRRPTPPPPFLGAQVARARMEHYKHHELVLITSVDGQPVRAHELSWGVAWVGTIGTVLEMYDFDRPLDTDDGEPVFVDYVHVLSKALGWDCAPEIVKGLGGLASLLAHGMGPSMPKSLDDAGLAYGIARVVTERLEKMAERAREHRAQEEAENTHFQAQMEKLSPGAPKKRERRGAATAAEQALAASAMDAVNLDGSVRKGFALQWPRRDRVAARRSNESAIREQKKAGGAEEWHRKREQDCGDGAWEPGKKRKPRSRSRTPTPTPEAIDPRDAAVNECLRIINSL